MGQWVEQSTILLGDADTRSGKQEALSRQISLFLNEIFHEHEHGFIRLTSRGFTY
jgi:hypothetical protein